MSACQFIISGHESGAPWPCFSTNQCSVKLASFPGLHIFRSEMLRKWYLLDSNHSKLVPTAFLRLWSKPVKCIPGSIVYTSNYNWCNNYLLWKLHKWTSQTHYRAWGLAIFRRQITYPCTKYKTRKVYLAGQQVKKSRKLDEDFTPRSTFLMPKSVKVGR